jgi:hypothetical protein
MQQRLRMVLSVNGAAFVRFLYGAPFALVFLLLALAGVRAGLPRANAAMLTCCAAGGLCQVLATNLLIMAFGFCNFAVGTSYSKTETAWSGIIALLALGEALHALAWTGIDVEGVGVLTLSLAGRGLRPLELAAATVQPAALCGLAAGFFFAPTMVFVMLAGETIEDPVLVRALFVLSVTAVLQTLMQGAYLAWRDPIELQKAMTTWRRSCWLGVLSAAGSACWRTA